METLKITSRDAKSRMNIFKVLFRIVWNRMEPQDKLQKPQELCQATLSILNKLTTGAAWRLLKYCLEMHGTAWSHRLNFKYYRSRM